MVISVLEVSGTFFEMGRQHGRAYVEPIRDFTEDRIRLSMNADWTGRQLSRDAVMALAEACVATHDAYSPELMAELRGMAQVTGLSEAALIINNGFTDFIDTVFHVGDITTTQSTPQVADDCTAFLIPPGRTLDQHGLFGQTWDMHASATPFVILMRGKPENYPEFLTFTVAGCIGMIGMNDAGIAVGINNLMANDGQIGVTWPFVVRKIMMQTSLDAALKCILDVPLAGAHNYLLMDKHGRGYNVEAMSTNVDVSPLANQPLVHTNHCLLPKNQSLERERPVSSVANSHERLERAGEELAKGQITPDTLMALTRMAPSICRSPEPPMHVETSGAAIMRPATGDFWAVWGRPNENEYEHFVV